MTQEQKKKHKRHITSDIEEKTEAVKHDTEAADNLLDEIDSVLEENAEDFVKAYVQKGGE